MKIDLYKYQELKQRIASMDFTEAEKDFIFSDWGDWAERLPWLLAATREEIQAWIDSNSGPGDD